ncbi:hypothetical protein CDAR_101211 [Caerostris darwini]|uniref:Uncharacterized protein n=1 Tax=Caerostris darwini TaxID=1538125 RepID=A0AAV4QIC3_9ARAC|nr:hypothetical protein CDAR_101211 [Caerostris darwini]
MKNESGLVAGAESVIRHTGSMLIGASNCDREPGIALGLETSAAITNSESVLSFKGANECCVNSSRIFDVEAFIHHYYTENSFGEGFQGTFSFAEFSKLIDSQDCLSESRHKLPAF